MKKKKANKVLLELLKHLLRYKIKKKNLNSTYNAAQTSIQWVKDYE